MGEGAVERKVLERGGGGGESDTEKLGGSRPAASHCAVMWSVSALHAGDAEAVSGRS